MAGALGLACLYRGMAIGAIGVIAPISASAAVVPVTVGLARGERPGAIQLAGVVLALVGVVLVSREPGASGGLSAGVPLALLAALGFGVVLRVHGPRERDDAYWAVVVARAAAATLAVTVATFAKRAARAGAATSPCSSRSVCSTSAPTSRSLLP